MENFFGKVIKIVSGDKSVTKDYWIDDSKCKACYECESAFSQWNRRHHCRICGRVFCANCTRNSIPPPRESADQQWLRVCNYCYRVRQRSDQPVARPQNQHVASRNLGSGVLDRTGSLRQLLDSESSLAPNGSGDLSAVPGSLARSRSGAFGRWGRSHAPTYRVASGDLSWLVPPPLEDDFGMSLADRDARLLYQQQVEAGAPPPELAVGQQQANSIGEVHRQLFAAAADSHLRSVVQQLLLVEAVPQPELWADLVSAAAQAVAAYLAPAQMYGNGQHDPRQALQIKKVADVGRPEDTAVVTGVVVRKGLVHRKMRSYIEYPKVLLLAGSLEYQRETNKLSSFDHMDHDKQYLANAVARLAVVKPDVVLVEGSVARMAQEDLLSRNISVAQKIKSKVLDRLARCMGVRVAPTVEHLTPATAHLYLGDCKVFRVEVESVAAQQQQAEEQQVLAAAAAAAVPTADGGGGVGAGQGLGLAAGPAASAPVNGGGGGVAAGSAPCVDSSSSLPQASQPPFPAGEAAPRPEPQPSEAPQPQPQPQTSGEGDGDAAAAPSEQLQPPPADPPPARLRPSLLDSDRGGYTSLSAAMMMRALGSGPGAAAAVAAVSGGAGAAAVVRSAASATAAQALAAAPAADAAAVEEAGGQGAGVAGSASSGAAAAAAGQIPAGGRTAAAALPAGPPPPPQVTLMYFEGCRPTTATVLLKGAPLELLRRLKHVLGFAVLTAWNQRLESAFLGDLLTAAVVAAGEEAYTNGGGLLSSSLLPPSSSAAAPSLAFFRHHAEAAVRASVAAACACGAPGILLSISPHCNAWDDSLVAEWVQQGFTFPHLQPQLLTQQPQQGQQGGQSGASSEDAVAAATPVEKEAAAAGEQAESGGAGEEGRSGEGEEAVGAAGEAVAAAPAEAAAGSDAPPLESEPTFSCSDETAIAAPATEASTEPPSQAAAGAAAEGAAACAADPAEAGATGPLALQSPFASEACQAAQQLQPGSTGACSTAAAAACTAGASEAGEPGSTPPVSVSAVAASQSRRQTDAEGAGAEGAAAAAGLPVVDAASQAGGSTGAPGGVAGQQAEQQQQQQPAESQQQQQAARKPVQQSALQVLQGQRIYSHQRIFVTCMFRRSRDRNLCDPFQVKQIDYYHRNSDVPLIRYIKMCTQQGWTCPGTGCPEPFTAHESVFFFGSHKLTIFYSTLPPIQALPGEEKNQVWHWTRPIGRGREGVAACRRVPLSPDSCYISMGRFLELSFSADGLDVFGRSLHYDHIRYFGLGRTLVCMFPERTAVYVMQLPDVVMSYSQQAQTKWLKQESTELVQEANDAFDLIEALLADSPHYAAAAAVAAGGFGGDAAAASSYMPATSVPAAAAGSSLMMTSAWGSGVHGGEAAAGGEIYAGSSNASYAPGTSPGMGGSYWPQHQQHQQQLQQQQLAAANAAAATLAALLTAARKDRSSFLSLVADCVARATMPYGAMMSVSAPDGSCGVVHWDEQVLAGMRELNRLRAVLARAVLQWAARLQDPVGFATSYSRLTGRHLANNNKAQHAPPPPQQQQQQPAAQPLAAASAVGASTAFLSSSSITTTTTVVATELSLLSAAPSREQLNPSNASTSSLTSLVAASSSAATTTTVAAATSNQAFAAAAATAAAAAAAAASSEGSVSLFSSGTPTVAAYRLGLLASQPSISSGEAISIATAAAAAAEQQQPPQPQHVAASEPTADSAAHALPIPIVPHPHGPLLVHHVAEMAAQQELRGGAGGQLLEGTRALLGGAAAPQAATHAAAAAAGSSRLGVGTGQSGLLHMGSRRMEIPLGGPVAGAVQGGGAGVGNGVGVAAEPGAAVGDAQAVQMTHGSDSAAGVGGSGGVQSERADVAAATAGSVAVTTARRASMARRASACSSFGGEETMAAAAGAASLEQGVAGGGGGGAGGGASSLPRSVSTSTIGDLADMAYLGGLAGDSGAEDNDEHEGREEGDDEEPDHDTFLAFVGSGAAREGRAASGGSRSCAAGGCAGGPEGRAGGGGGGADGSYDEDAEDSDGAYYYRALFSQAAGGEDGAAAAAQQQQHHHPQRHVAGASSGLVVHAPTSPTAAAAAGSPSGGSTPTGAIAAALASAEAGPSSSSQSPRSRLGLQSSHAAAASAHPFAPQPNSIAAAASAGVAAASAAISIRTTGAINIPPTHTTASLFTDALLPSSAAAAAATAPPLVAGTWAPGAATLMHPDTTMPPPTFGAAAVASATLGASVAVGSSRRQLLTHVRRRLDQASAAALAGAAAARGFLPLPGRAMLPPGVNDTVIPIFDGEPTSIIAYALSTRSFQQQLNAGYKAIFGRARAESGASRGDRERDMPPPPPPQPAADFPQHLQQQQGVPPQMQANGGEEASAALPASGPPFNGAWGAAGGVVDTSSNSIASAVPSAAVAASTAVGGSIAASASAASFASNGSGSTHSSTHHAPMPPPSSTSSATAAAASVPLPPPPPPLQPQQPPPPPPSSAAPDADWWTVLTSKEACHVRVSFEDDARGMPWARAKFAVTAHFAPQFAELRRRCIQGGEAAFVASMCRCKRWESRGGKSNAYFAKTRDDRYIVKSLSKSEKASFMNFAPHYFAHMGRHLLNRDSPTCLAKILGVYSVSFKPAPGSAGVEGSGAGGAAGAAASAALIKEMKDREFSQDLLVMENCFYDRPVARIYDLKGSERNRFNADAASRPEDRLEVHLDDNLRRTMHTAPIFVDARSRAAMEAAVWADTGFLAAQDVMDYSLLVGVDRENGVLALAIIDFIRQYTWDKQLETWVKSSGMLGGNGKEPTIISPKQYTRRFRGAMQQYFTAVPGSAGAEVPRDPDAAQ